MNEMWKNVPGYERYYQISNLGNIRSKDRLTRNNRCRFIKKGKILKPQPNSNGYLRIYLVKDGSPKKYFFIHRLVALAFVENRDGKPHVNHIDSNYLNNRADNLEWVTHSENMHHAINKGRFGNHFEKTKKLLLEFNAKQQKAVIGTNIKTGEILRFKSIQEAGRYFNNRAGDICRCCKGQRKTAQGYKWKYAG